MHTKNQDSTASRPGSRPPSPQPQASQASRPSSPSQAPRRRVSPDAEFQRWLAKYEPVERAIIEERARRLASAEKRRMRRRLAFAAECEATEGLAASLRRNRSGGKRRGSDGRGPEGRGAASGGAPLARIGNTGLHVLDGGIVSVLLSVVGVACTRDVDAMRHRLKRPIYYARENARRRALAAERRKVLLRETTNPCPTREEVLDAWVRAKDSREAMLRFGGMMEDLECYVDNSLRFGRNGEVVGRAPGIKGWLQMNIPALYSKYKTIMRYKAAAKKLRQVVGLADPTPVSTILAEAGVADETDGRGGEAVGGVNEILMRTKSNGMDGRRMVAALRARAIYLEAMDGVPDNATRTIQRLDELLDPERVEDATMLRSWKERYGNEITMRTKSRWLDRLFGKIGKGVGIVRGMGSVISKGVEKDNVMKTA